MVVAWGEDRNSENKIPRCLGLARGYFMLKFYVSATK